MLHFKRKPGDTHAICGALLAGGEVAQAPADVQCPGCLHELEPVPGLLPYQRDMVEMIRSMCATGKVIMRWPRRRGKSWRSHCQKL